MKTTSTAINRKILRNIILLFAVVLLISAIIWATVNIFELGVAFADEQNSAQKNETFSVLFPSQIKYTQSEDPSLVAANDGYLIVYDKSASTLFVRGGNREGTYAFPLNIDGVEYIKAVGNTAFIHAQGQNYTVDLTDISAKPIARELISPENANYFRSDGTYLYAKNGYGAISIYDENLEIASFTVDDETVTVDNQIYTDNTNNPVFAGKQVLAGNDHQLYFLSVLRGNPYFIVYDPVTQKEIANELMDCYVTEAYVGDDIVVAQISSGMMDSEENTPLVGLDKKTGKTLFSSDITPDSFCVYGDKLFTIEGNKIVTYTIETAEVEGVISYVGFKEFTTICMAGNDAYHLDNPSDIIKFSSGYAIADTNNNRIAYVNTASMMTSSVAIGTAPLRITADLTGVYALCSNDTVIKLENNEVVQSFGAQDAVDITYFANKLYILKTNGLFVAIGKQVFQLASIEGGRRITCAKDGSNIYILKDDGIEVYSSDGTLINFMECDLTDAVDFAIDYAGQIVVMRENGYDLYTNNGSLNLQNSTELYCGSAHAKANSVYLDGQTLYFSAEECLIGRTLNKIETTTKDDYNTTPFEPSFASGYHFAKLKADTQSFAIPIDGRMEAIYPAPSKTVLVLDNDDSETYATALLDGNFFKIRKSDFETIQTNTLSGDYATNCDTVLYALPNVETNKKSVAMGTRVALVADCADFENSKWIRVSYNSQVYFINADHVNEYIELIPEKDRHYGKAKATRVGGLVNIYSSANESSDTLTQIVDGTKIEVLEKVDGFYLVKYEDLVGYMKEKEVQLDGLTTVQIISIVVACIVAVAGIGVFIAIEVTKKKSEQAERRADKRNRANS